MTRTVEIVLNPTVVSVSGTVNGESYIFQLIGSQDDMSIWAAVVTRSVDDIYHVVIAATSQNGVSTEIDTTVYYGLHLITDRTEEDVNRVKAMLAKGWANLTEAEQTEWNAGMKGAYNYTDLNRVEMAVSYLKDYLAQYGYVAGIGPLRTWTEKDVPTVSDMQRYLDNVRIIRSVLNVFPSTPQVPASMENFTFTKANQLERILQDVESLVNNMVAAFVQVGEIYGGEL